MGGYIEEALDSAETNDRLKAAAEKRCCPNGCERPLGDCVAHLSRAPSPSAGWGRLTDAQRADIEAHIRGLTEDKETYTLDGPPRVWRCFHCGNVFRTPEGAALHFGKAPDQKPRCFSGHTDAMLAAIQAGVEREGLSVKLSWPNFAAYVGTAGLDEAWRRVIETALASLTAAPPAATFDREEVAKVADLIVRDVAELPDRTSPDDWPEAMLVTGEELHALIVERFSVEEPA